MVAGGSHVAGDLVPARLHPRLLVLPFLLLPGASLLHALRTRGAPGSRACGASDRDRAGWRAVQPCWARAHGQRDMRALWRRRGWRRPSAVRTDAASARLFLRCGEWYGSGRPDLAAVLSQATACLPDGAGRRAHPLQHHPRQHLSARDQHPAGDRAGLRAHRPSPPRPVPAVAKDYDLVETVRPYVVQRAVADPSDRG